MLLAECEQLSVQQRHPCISLKIRRALEIIPRGRTRRASTDANPRTEVLSSVCRPTEQAKVL